MNRVDKKGTYTVAYGKNVIGKTKNGYKIDFIGSHPSKEYFNTRIGSNKILKNKQYKKATGYTLKSFMENNPVHIVTGKQIGRASCRERVLRLV